MEFEKLDKAYKLYDQIKRIDAEIIAIEKAAMDIANGDIEIEFTLELKTPPAELNATTVEDSDDDYRDAFRRFISEPLFFGHGYKKLIATPNPKFIAQINETAALQILGVLLGEKQDKRKALMNRVEKLMAIK